MVELSGLFLIMFIPLYSIMILVNISMEEILKLIFISFPNTIDFIITYFYYSLEAKGYFNIRYINQIFLFLFIVGVYDLIKGGSRDGIGNILPLLSLIFIIVVTIVLEIKSFRKFSELYDNFPKFYIIDYYFHFTYVFICIPIFYDLKRFLNF